MLQIKDVVKIYKNDGSPQTALRGVSLNLRDNEFVAILGASGSGKTTLLNIIGGLDVYDEGDMIINNVSTKKYKDRDWDSYRNHTVGFVFQSYNLIPHQTVLKNVELALTIGGISPKERKERAIKALEEVGLHEQIDKKPSQLSGGQMQRVAIARALVNNPDILLADEPTGALDTKTSIQVMDLLKQVAKDRLVVMVTHNPELADTYANRIISLKDGQIVADTNPFYIDESKLEAPKHKNLGKSSMSIFTAFSLSFNNLLTKKGRTILTAFAGSIGIIGIALILSLSQGFQNYIDQIQEETLYSYPLRITSETADASSIILGMVGGDSKNDGTGLVTENQFLQKMFSSVGTNDIKSFKKHLENNNDEVSKYVTNVVYSYSVSPYIYSYDAAGNLAQLNPSSLMSMFYSGSAMSMLSSYSSSMGIFFELSNDQNSLNEQYDILQGRWPEKYNEVVLILSEPNGISDLLIYSLGLRDTTELKGMLTKITSGETITATDDPEVFTYDELMSIKMRLIKQADLYEYNEKYDIYEDMSKDEEYMDDLYKHSEDIKIVGIMCPKNGGGTLSSGIGYTQDLTKYVIRQAEESEIVQKQLADNTVDVFSGDKFDEKKESTGLDFNDMVTIDEDTLKEAFKVNFSESDFKVNSLSEEEMKNLVMDQAAKVSEQIKTGPTVEQLVQVMTQGFLNGSKGVIDAYSTNVNFYGPSDHTSACEKWYSAIPAARIATGCSLEGITPGTEDQYIQVQGATGTIYVKETAYTTYVPLADQAVNAYKAAAINKKILQDDKLVEVATNAFDSYIAGAKAIAPTEYFGQFISKTDIDTIDTTGYISTEMTKPETISYIQNKSVENVAEYTKGMVALGMSEVLTKSITPLANSLQNISKIMSGDIISVDTNKFAQAFNFDMDEDQLTRIMETMLTSSEENTYNSNLIKLGYQDLDNPTSISFYFNSFENKEGFLDLISKYNDSVVEDKQINYTDLTGVLMSSVKTIVDSVTYVLIAFCSISLIVSSIMIAVITLISVMERTKEIGILRAIGASKHNVSSIFNAETFIIGLLSGLLGVGVTLLLNIPINNIIHSLTGNPNITAVLPWKYAVILIIISILLTLIAGFFPSKTAAKKDPVVALRTE